MTAPKPLSACIGEVAAKLQRQRAAASTPVTDLAAASKKGWVLPGRAVAPRCAKKGHRLVTRPTGWMEFYIGCRRRGCAYREINPNGTEARLFTRGTPS